MARVDVDGVGTEYEVTGEGPPVVLLHGFPDSGRLWRHQVPALAGAGFQVIVPDLRGYGRSDKPEAVEAYSLMNIAGDVLAILADLNIPRAHVVGHDWGAALAWALATFRPDTVVPGHRRALADRGQLAQLPDLGRASRRRPGGLRSGSDRVADARPQLVPGQRPARVVGRPAAAAAAGAGFQVIVPDLRGYGRSDKPEAVEAYSLMHIAGDVIAILADLNAGPAHVVGHDWGAALAWALASFRPDQVDHLVTLSVGHPATFRRTPRQREKAGVK